MQQPISPAGHDDSCTAEHGFTLLELVCVVAILTIIAALLPPMLSRGTSRAKLESYAIAIAALLKADRNAALRRHMQVATELDAKSRLVRSGATKQIVRIPDDVTVDTLVAATCNGAPNGSAIRFFPSGMSCGGVVSLTRINLGFEIRVNWLTAGVEIVSLDRT